VVEGADLQEHLRKENQKVRTCLIPQKVHTILEDWMEERYDLQNYEVEWK
jgi:hypothetical protein